MDEIGEILDKTTKEKMEQALEILGVETEKKSGLQILTAFIKRIKEVGLLEYTDFLHGIKGNDRRNS